MIDIDNCVVLLHERVTQDHSIPTVKPVKPTFCLVNLSQQPLNIECFLVLLDIHY